MPRIPVAPGDALLTPAEVSQKFRVHPKTVTRWVKAGKLTAVRTPGGHRRYHADQVDALLAQVADPAPATPAQDAQ